MAEYKILKNVVGNELLYGNTVYFTESGESIPYILVQQGNSHNYLFMRKYAPPDKIAFFAEATDFGVTDSERIYEGHTLDKFMTETFYNRFTADWQRIFVNNNISVTRASDGLSYGINRKVFAASATELCIEEQSNGTVPVESPFGAYRYFRTGAQSRRKCQLGNSNGDYVEYWTRSKNNHVGVTFNYYALTIDKGGSYDTGSWQINKYCTRPVISINENVSIFQESSGWRIIPNLPPKEPSAVVRYFTIKNGETFNLSWNGSDDDDGQRYVPKYRIQALIDSGEWVDVVETSDTSFSETLAYKEVEREIEYRVQAFDSYNNTSNWVNLAKITVINNLPPTGPSYITVNGKYKHESIAVSWGDATDEDGNLQGYKVYRSVNNGAYALVSTTASTVFRETAGDWNTVKYKVHAYDTSGEISTEYKEAAVSLSTRITMSIVVADDSEIADGGVYAYSASSIEEGFALKVTLSDSADGESYAVVVSCDGSLILGTIDNAAIGDLTFDISKEVWQQLSNGSHNIVVTVENSSGYTVTTELTFKKQTTGAYLTLAEPVLLDSDEPITEFLMNVVGSFPEGSTLSVEVTNNANDDVPAWQTVSNGEINTNGFVEFSNTVVENGNAFNFRVIAERETATESGYISSINGMFGQNMFSYILARLDAIEGG